ncbi:hypothetical protein H8M03_06520 [Sphingomonas sabuli]|uniref:Uncharacterized protein n=1 Tax=Sphingomonas sabuli TaxID=2764186 RepID=A0A7G9KZC9_9SPHN|nr:hypothetical protein [Sphingomonas sabuli]QNM81728.1 hypothetical protein H8M03_06520 [Sphingomonas sabuli]
MVLRAKPSAAQRYSTLGGVIAAHGIALLVVLSYYTPGQRAAKPSAIHMVSLAAVEQPSPKPPKPVMPSKLVAKPIPPQELAAAMAEAAAPAPASTVGTCETLNLISAALQSDTGAVAEVAAVPEDMRSVADAIVVWNAGWSAPAQVPDGPLSIVRMVIEARLNAVAEGCLDETLAGPRLIPVHVGERTTMLAFGSGNWTWRQLVEPPPPAVEQQNPFFTIPWLQQSI